MCYIASLRRGGNSFSKDCGQLVEARSPDTPHTTSVQIPIKKLLGLHLDHSLLCQELVNLAWQLHLPPFTKPGVGKDDPFHWTVTGTGLWLVP